MPLASARTAQHVRQRLAPSPGQRQAWGQHRAARTGAGGVPIHLRDRTPRTWL